MITYRQLEKILRSNKYVLLRSADSMRWSGVNCKVVDHSSNIKHKNNLINLDKFTYYDKVKPCNINEYISNKMDF